MHVILMGPQGSGKGTQAERLLPRLGLVAIATGELFRAAAKQGTALGLRAKALMDRGELVPDDVTIGLVEEKLDALADLRRIDPAVRGALFDGFPRTEAQARALDEVLARRGEQVDTVVLIDVPRGRLVERLAGRRVCSGCGHVYHVVFNPPAVDAVCDICGSPVVQRADDTAEAVQKRLDTYDRTTAPLLAFYQARGILTTVDGDRPIEEVTEAIVRVVQPAPTGAGRAG
jgi:adenylate kinase